MIKPIKNQSQANKSIIPVYIGVKEIVNEKPEHFCRKRPIK